MSAILNSKILVIYQAEIYFVFIIPFKRYALMPRHKPLSSLLFCLFFQADFSFLTIAKDLKEKNPIKSFR